MKTNTIFVIFFIGIALNFPLYIIQNIISIIFVLERKQNLTSPMAIVGTI